MTKIWTFLLILTVSTFWIHVPHKGEIGFILNPDVKLSYNQYIWMTCTYLVPIILASIILDEAQSERRLTRIFLFLLVADYIGFVISYDDPFKDYWITFNIAKVLIFGVAILIEKHERF
jgi:hypothetical protein